MMKRRSGRGQGIIEAVSAAMVLIPLALFLLDFIVLIIANTSNDTLCKNMARAAANQSTETLALDSAHKILADFKPSGIVTKADITINGFLYDGPGGTVTVTTKIVVHFPMPIPGFSDLSFVAKDVEPIVNFKPQDLQ